MLINFLINLCCNSYFMELSYHKSMTLGSKVFYREERVC